MLWWLLALIPMWAVFQALHRRRQIQLGKLVAETHWSTLLSALPFRQNRQRTLLRLLAAGLLIVALARPQWGFHWEEVKQRGLNILVLLDTSKSMLAEDIKPNRLQQAQWAVRDLLDELQGDKVGLIAFAGGSFLQCPLTVDYAAFMMQLDDLYAGIIPKGGTDTGAALKTALASFEAESAADNVVILISDGEDHEGRPLAMVDELKKNGVRVFSVGVGTAEGELIPVRDQAGRVSFLKDRDDNVVKTRLQEQVLRDLALKTGGFYVRSAPGDFGLDRIYKEGIASLQTAEQESRRARVYEERFPWFVGAALLVLLLEAAVLERRRAE
jgi:Ca-activated chloride channel family protein